MKTLFATTTNAKGFRYVVRLESNGCLNVNSFFGLTLWENKRFDTMDEVYEYIGLFDYSE